MNENTKLPPVVTFATGAELLVKRGVVESITARGVRYIAATHSEWPFGDGRQHPYVKISNAKAMDTEVFLAFFDEHPPSGRGPAKQPRSTGSES